MRLPRHNFCSRPRASRSGVALVITVVMLSVILFLTVAFLALMGREKGSVKTSIDQSTARMGAEAALERAKAELLAGIIASTNIYNYGLLVSTNYYNWNGFDPASQNPTNFDKNVNFDYQVGGAALTANQFLDNLTNLLFSPRVPVYIYNQVGATNEFRYYLDLNRNRRHDVTGLWPVLSSDPVNRYVNTNGFLIPAPIPGNTLSNFVVGDPEWIGGLDRPDKPHGPENKYLFRYAYAAVPVGLTLDVNFIHNNAKPANMVNGFLRDQGVGGWELNLAAFLRDLNTNQWGAFYVTNLLGLPDLALPSTGTAFDDAYNFWLWRRGGVAQSSVQALFGNRGSYAFENDFVDGYSSGSTALGGILSDLRGYAVEPDVAPRTTSPWPGADLVNHYFTAQDLFNPTKTSAAFVNRLNWASTNLSTYDQYTYYRMLQQLGTDSAPEDPDKLNLNYVNVRGLSATNFIRWTDTNSIQAELKDINLNPSVFFFTNAVDKLLSRYTTEWIATDYTVYTNIFKVTQPFSVTNIPVFVSNQFVYPAAVQRILQVAANIWDVQSDKRDGNGELPTVFRPLFTKINNDVYITGFREAPTVASLQTVPRPILDLTSYASNNLPSIVEDDLIFGVPLVIGARKGLPNFNEFATESTFQITRKLELRKSSAGGADRISQTNQFFVLSFTMPSAAEFWNSYASNYSRPVFIYVTNRTTMLLTNDAPSPVSYSQTFVTGGFDQFPKSGVTGWPAAATRSYNDFNNPASFVVTMRTNVPFLPLVGYLPSAAGNAGFVSATNLNLYDKDQTLPAPRWGVTITNRIQAMIVEQSTGRILDYVLLGDLTSHRNLSEEISTTDAGTLFNRLWATNALGGGRVSGRYGVMAQVQVSKGFFNYPSEEWKNYGNFNSSSVASEVAKFLAFFDPAGEAGFQGKLGTNRSLQAIVPFSPSRQMSMPMVWAANDPLVHYISSELFDIPNSGKPQIIMPPGRSDTNQLANIGKKNKRYRPWPKETGEGDSDPDAFNLSMKDPLVRSSDEWLFPTNTLPTVGWLGRIHRGTPWQTIYLKASNVGLTNIVRSPSEWVGQAYRLTARKWAEWTGNKTYEEGFYTRPVSDRLLFDVFTTSLNDNSARGRLPVNQTNLAAWSAVFSGVTYASNSLTDFQLTTGQQPQFVWNNIQPAGVYDPLDATTWPPLVRMVRGINAMRANTNFFPNGVFSSLGDVLAVPELTDASPFLNQSTAMARTRGLTDAAYEWIPQQTMSLLQQSAPRFAIYAYGQALKPAPESIITDSGGFFGLCTNYAITAEVGLRAIVRVEGSPNPSATNTFLPVSKRYPPHIVVESFNYLPPE